MGLYDTVRFRCMECGKIIEVQSKAGDCCCWDTLNGISVSPEIASELDGAFVCCDHCGTCFTLEAQIELTLTRR